LNKAKSVSIKDIARIAQVSHTTVSRALRNKPRISDETTKRIQRIATEHGYHPSLAARSLVTQRTQTVGCVVTSIADPFAAGIVSGIEEVANRNGYSVVLANSKADPKRELEVVESLREHRVDGILVAASRLGSRYIPHLRQLQIPIVLINNLQPGDFVNCVTVDNRAAARLVVNHLLNLGHRDIAYIGRKIAYIRNESGDQSNCERRSGYSQALQEAGIAIRSDFVVQAVPGPEGGEERMHQLLRLTVRPTAVFCYNDMIALGALKAIRRAKLSVPADISVAGFDDIFVASYTDPPLTTVRQPMTAMGRRAMGILLELLSRPAEETRTENWRVTVSGELVIRESTGRPKSPAP
jgi:LacI family transcriptional regulator/LacI family repressor for deo operon, udp, cdd, tsx, nupC, and nupG